MNITEFLTRACLPEYDKMSQELERTRNKIKSLELVASMLQERADFEEEKAENWKAYSVAILVYFQALLEASLNLAKELDDATLGVDPGEECNDEDGVEECDENEG